MRNLPQFVANLFLFSAIGLAQTTGKVSVTSPVSGSTVASPVHFVASAQAPSGHYITAMRIYVDYVSVYYVKASKLDTYVSMTQGYHKITVQAWDNSGTVYKQWLSLTATSSTTSGTAYYVSPTGSDSNSGSAAAPWATIQHAANVAKAGSVVHVASGTYGAVATSTSGSSTARIRFISDVKWGAKIRTTGISQMWYNTANYIDIMGFDISGDGRLGILNMGSFVRMIGNNIHNIPAPCGSSGGAGIDNANYYGSDDDVIGNVVHDIGDPTVQCYAVHGIYHANLRGHILNNISYHNEGWGIHLWHAANNVVVSNNLVFQNGAGGIVVGDGDSPGGVVDDYTTVSNNIVMDNYSTWSYGRAIYESGATGTHNRYLNNLIWNNGAGIVLQNGLQDVDTINADPQLVNYQPDGGGDYHLQSTSRAINSGTTIGMPPKDFDGAPRPFGTGPDRGPYEYGSTATPWPWM